MENPISNRRRSGWATLASALLTTLLLPLTAIAGNVDDVSKLAQRGQLNQALALAEQRLAQQPQDASLRFLKGVLLAQMERKPEAIETFTALTHDFPKLPEPHNNLGVLLAAAGEFDQARQALQRAIELAPGYAIAHENLGDLYARLATVSYDNAARLDANNAGTRNKLTLARSLNDAVLASTSNRSTTATTARSATSATSAGSATSVPSTPSTPSSTTNASPASVAAATTTSATAKGSGAAAAAPASPAASNDQQKPVLDAVTRWANAWSARDMQAYLSSYAADFIPAGGMSIDAWSAQRKERIVDRAEIRVEVQQPEVRIDGDRATVKFVQKYESGQYRSVDVKVLEMVKRGERWLIRQEQVASSS